DRELVERRRRDRRGGVEVETDRVHHERRERGLVLPVEGDAFEPPSPPLLVLDVGHGFSPSGESVGPRIRGGCSALRRSISALMRAMNSGGFSPSRGVIGAPNTTPTGSRPDLGQLDPRGCARPAPTSAIGTTGHPTAAASAAAPGLKLPSTR